MNPHCGNCKWWDDESKIKAWKHGIFDSLCFNPKSIWVESYPSNIHGKTCPVYEERKECEE